MIDYVFGGVILDRIQCHHCNAVSRIFHSEFDLSIEVGDRHHAVERSVTQALEARFVEPQVNAYACTGCKRSVTRLQAPPGSVGCAS